MKKPNLSNRQPITNFTRSDELLERAAKSIPLASQTFSKSAMMFVKGASPLFAERAEGCRIWDVDGNEYIDFVLGLLPVVLGYCDPDVDEAVRKQLDKGIVFSLSSQLESELSERLIRLIPCAEMVRFGKNGSDATSAAVRLARAYTGRDRVISCGYHGWHDWYIGTTTRNLGVPRAVAELTTAIPFNQLDPIADLLKRRPDDFAAIVLEPAGVVDPLPGYLQSLRELADKYGVLLIFDEIVTGFRIHLGGAQAYYDVTPDLACFGKAMGNGMPISAVVGRKQIMMLMEEIFFSGTFGGELLSLAACQATLSKLEALDGPSRLAEIGGQLKTHLNNAVEKLGAGDWLAVGGPNWWPTLGVQPTIDAPILVTSLLRQELCANGILTLGTLNLALSHCNSDVVDNALQRFTTAIDTVNYWMRRDSLGKNLRGTAIEPVFRVRP